MKTASGESVGNEATVADRVDPHPSHTEMVRKPAGRYLLLLAFGALGVVYGDIGTSPLYAVRECFHGDHGIPVNRHNVLGVLSLIFWALTLIVSIKYIAFVLRADNRGEGGVLALMSLAMPGEARGKSARRCTLGVAHWRVWRRAVVWRRNHHACGFHS